MSDPRPTTGPSNPWLAGLTIPLTAVLLVLWRTRGMAGNFGGLFGPGAGGASHDLWSFVYQFGTFFVLFLVVPFAVLRGRRPVASLGLGKPRDARVVAWTLLAIPIVVAPIAWFGSRMPEVRAAYPMLRSLPEHREWLLPYEAAYVLLYYVAWEAFFRGWLLFTVEAAIGPIAAVLVQTAASSIAHVGKPFTDAEVWGAIPFGIVTGWVALRTRSVWPTVLLHASLGVGTDLLVVFGGGRGGG